MDDNDLSHVFANDPDEGQNHHGNLPHEAMLHLARGFAHKAGLREHPGKYSGPAIKAPADFETPDDSEGQREVNQSEAIANPVDFGNAPEIPQSNRAAL